MRSSCGLLHNQLVCLLLPIAANCLLVNGVVCLLVALGIHDCDSRLLKQSTRELGEAEEVRDANTCEGREVTNTLLQLCPLTERAEAESKQGARPI